MFVPSESILEVFLRGTVMYLGMLLMLRVFRRQSGTLGAADLLVIVVIADAAQNGMAGDSKSITEALLLISTIIMWDWLIDMLGYKSALFSRILEPQPLLLIENGVIKTKNLEKEMITEDELWSQLRENGIEDVDKVKKCYLESNGHFSVLTASKAPRQQKSNDSLSGAVN